MWRNFYITEELTKLPFTLYDGDIIYCENEYDENLNRYIQMHYHEICTHFKSRGFEFIYFPRLDKNLVIEIMHHLYPECQNLPAEHISLKTSCMYELLPEKVKKEIQCPCFIYSSAVLNEDEFKEHNWGLLVDIYFLGNPDSIYDTNNLSGLLDQLEEDHYFEFEYDGQDEPTPQEYKIMERGYYCDNKTMEESESEIQESLQNNRSKKIKAMIKDINDKIHELNKLDPDSSVYRYYLKRGMSSFTTYSDIKVNKRYQIELPDEKIIMPFPAQMRALYLLYLNHPEGINYLNVEECREELLQWYKWCEPRNPDEKIIDNLFEVKKNERHPIVSLISRIKKEINNCVGSEIGERYYIRHEGNGFYRIDTTGYSVTFEVKNPFKIDMSPVVKKANIK